MDYTFIANLLCSVFFGVEYIVIFFYMCCSYFPWFEIFYRLLNHLAELLNQGKTVAVWSLLVELHESHVPRQGMFIELHVDSADTVGATTLLYRFFHITNLVLCIFCTNCHVYQLH